LEAIEKRITELESRIAALSNQSPA
jgi:uncharacterized coiled-coil protein SlyX